jgi:ferric-dicitrate binding protein FerR (iron transport regulator)
MALRCGRARGIALGALGGHASVAERLELEGHLATCAACGADHQILGLVRRLRDAEPEGLTAAARDRVGRALAARPAPPAAEPRRLAWPIALGGALAVAAGVVFWSVAARPVERVVGGDVVVGAAGAGPNADRDGIVYRSARGGRLVLGDAAADLAADTEIVWRRKDRTVDLRRGGLTVDVEHRPGQHFAVVTGHFRVEVVGTRFDVDAGGVRTERGTVRILDGDGRTLATVGAGESWSSGPPALALALTHMAGPVAPTPALAPVAPPSEIGPPAPSTSAATAFAPTAFDRNAFDRNAFGRLTRARQALAAGHAQEARRLVEPVFRLGRDVAVEARAVYAESFLTEGRYTDAIDGYHLVVRDFDGTPQAESALYAVAQLESEHGRPEQAKAALRGYLTRYPHGRFAREAGARLARLAP